MKFAKLVRLLVINVLAMIWLNTPFENQLALAQRAPVVISVAWSPSGNKLATGYSNGNIKILDIGTNQTTQIGLAQDAILSLSWNSTENLLAAAFLTGGINIYDITSGNRLISLETLSTSTTSVAWSPDGTMLASSNGGVNGFDNNHNVIVWDTTSWDVLYTFVLHIEQINQVAWNPNPTSHLLASAASDGTVVIWDINTGKEKWIFYNPGGVPSIAWNADGNLLAAMSPDQIHIWDVMEGANIQDFESVDYAINSVVWANNGNQIAFIDGQVVRVVDVLTGQTIQTFSTNSIPDQLAWSVSGDLAFGNDDSVDIVQPTPPEACTYSIASLDTPGLIATIYASNSTTIGTTTICLANNGFYNLDQSFTDFAGPTGFPPISRNIIIEGNNSIIQRDPASANHFRIFGVNSTGTLELNNLTIRNGLIDQNAGAGLVIVNGVAHLTNVKFVNNQSTHTTDGRGGAVFNYFGTLTMNGGYLLNNQAASSAGALFNWGGTITAHNGCFVNNSAPDDLAVANFEANEINVSQNWWGAIDGPSGAGSGSGDGISTGVNPEPVSDEAPTGCVDNAPTPTPVATFTETAKDVGEGTPDATFTPTSTFTPSATNTSTPTNTPTETSGTFPSTGVLDNFNRANGTIGSNWSGTTTGYSIASNQAVVSTGDAINWNAATFGVDQEAFVTVDTIDTSGQEIDLLLKTQSGSWPNGTIEIWYHPTDHIVQVMTYAPSQGWVQHGDDIEVTFADGDQFGARAKADGTVEVYENGTLLGSRDVTAWPFYANGGSIGLWMIGVPNTILDDFGGGNVGGGASPTATPTPTPVPGVTPSATPTGGSTTGLLDNFDRDDGDIGSKWTLPSANSYAISSNQLAVTSGGVAYWNSSVFDVDQEAYVTLASINPSAEEIDLLLKVQDGDWNNGAIEVLYNPGTSKVQVWAYTSSQNWVQRGGDLSVTFAAGDQFRARAKANGTLEIYQNTTLLGTIDISGWSYNANGGSIGLWMVNVGNTLLDNFGGGSLEP